jgi:hypothetical protein
MSRRPAAFTQADVARALRAAEQVAPGRMTIEITPGGVIRIRPIEAAPSEPQEAAMPSVASEVRIIL